jgi:hypothetical protein
MRRPFEHRLLRSGKRQSNPQALGELLACIARMLVTVRAPPHRRAKTAEYTPGLLDFALFVVIYEALYSRNVHVFRIL